MRHNLETGNIVGNIWRHVAAKNGNDAPIAESTILRVGMMSDQGANYELDNGTQAIFRGCEGCIRHSGGA
jgi:hypothetical protein